jgi:pimeloyl-ACP methyl ester carboxylesterase
MAGVHQSRTGQRDTSNQQVTITSADGTALAARRTGHGSPIVLVHGANGDLDTFALIEGTLAELHTVWAYSRRGRGGSADGPVYTLEREIEDLLAVLAVAGDGTHLLGHSGGAIYSLLAAAQAPSLRSLVLYEPPLHFDRFDPLVIARTQAALDADDPDRALETIFPAIGITEDEVHVLRSIPPVWERLRVGVGLVPRELRTGFQALDRLRALDPPSVPTLYLYGENTDASVFAPPDEVGDLLPNAELHHLPRQRHLAFAFDPSRFAEAVLEFTTTHEG